MFFPFDVVADDQQPHVVGKLGDVGQMLAVERDRAVVAEILVVVVQFAERRALDREAAVVVVAVRLCVHIVSRRDDVDLFAALFLESMQHFAKCRVAFLLAVERQVSRDQHDVGFVPSGKLVEHGAVDRLGLGKTFLLGIHVQFIIRAVRAQRIFKEMRVGGDKESQFLQAETSLIQRNLSGTNSDWRMKNDED